MTPTRSERAAGARSQAGYTVIELIVASFLGGVVLLAFGITYLTTERSFKVGARKLVSQQEATLLSGTISRFARTGTDFQIYNVPDRVTPADSGNGLAILDEGGAVVGRIEWNGTDETLVDAGGTRVTSMTLAQVKFKKVPALPTAIAYRYATDDLYGNLVNIESTVTLRN